MGREFELKFRCKGDVFAHLAEKYAPLTEISMETTYYDTPDRRLGARCWTLRRRLENGVSVCTLKTPDPNGGRGEWEVRESEITSAIPMLCKLGAPMELTALTQEGVEPVCGARFTRLARKLEVPGGIVELALDRGTLLGGNRELPLQEVEIELKQGTDDAACAFAASLASQYALTPEHRSKYSRALALAAGEI